MTDPTTKPDTLLAHAGSHPEDNLGAVNPPVYRVSTVVFDNVAAMQAGANRPYDTMRYGRHGTPTSFAFEEAVCALEGGYRSIATCSGQAAIASTLAALLQAGDHALIADSVYIHFRRHALRRAFDAQKRADVLGRAQRVGRVPDCRFECKLPGTDPTYASPCASP